MGLIYNINNLDHVCHIILNTPRRRNYPNEEKMMDEDR